MDKKTIQGINIFSIAEAIDRGEGCYGITTSRDFSELVLYGRPTNIVFGDAAYDFLRIGFSYQRGILCVYHLEDVSEQSPCGVFELSGIAKDEIGQYENGRSRIGDALLSRNHVYQASSKDKILKLYNNVLNMAMKNPSSFATLVDRLNKRK